MVTDPKSRRRALGRIIAMGCLLLAQPWARAAGGKATKAQVQYQDHPNGEQKCVNCMHFVPPNGCKVVEGDIAPDAWCKVWVKGRG